MNRYGLDVLWLVFNAHCKRYSGKPSKTRWRRIKKKIFQQNRLPSEATYLFQKLEDGGYNVNTIDQSILADLLNYVFSRINKDDAYDRDLAGEVGYLEVLRWRTNDPLKDDASFGKILEKLKEHALPKRPPTKVEQKPRVRFAPKGEYHKKRNL